MSPKKGEPTPGQNRGLVVRGPFGHTHLLPCSLPPSLLIAACCVESRLVAFAGGLIGHLFGTSGKRLASFSRSTVRAVGCLHGLDHRKELQPDHL